MSTVSSFPTLASVLTQPGHEALGAGSGSYAHEELGKLQQEFEQAWREAGGGTLRSPSLGGTSTTHYLGAMLDEIQERRSALCMKPYEPPTYKPSCTEGQASTNVPPWVFSLPPPPPLRRVNAFRLEEESEFVNRVTPVHVLIERLAVFRANLKARQDALFLRLESTQQVERARNESIALGNKIGTIEGALLIFGFSGNPLASPVNAEELFDDLRSLRLEYKGYQREPDTTEDRFETLENRIHAIEHVLSAFGVSYTNE